MEDKWFKVVLVGCKVYGVEVLGALWDLYFLQETVCLIMFTPIQRGMSYFLLNSLLNKKLPMLYISYTKC